MSQHPLNNSPLSPVEKLSNVYGSLADDVFDVPLDTDEETNQRASRVARTAIDKALNSGESAGSSSEMNPPPPFTSKQDTPPSVKSYASYTRNIRMRRFARRFGLHPVTAVVLTVISVALNAVGWMTFGAGFLLYGPVALGLGALTWWMQRRLYDEDFVPAGLKGIAVIVLSALPIAPLFFVAAGVIGWIWGRTEKQRNKKRQQASETVHK